MKRSADLKSSALEGWLVQLVLSKAARRVALDLHRERNLRRVECKVLCRQLWYRSGDVQWRRRVQGWEEGREGRVEEVGGNQVRVEGGVEQVRVEAGWIRGNQVGNVGRQVT